jgi:hypothetical protein
MNRLQAQLAESACKGVTSSMVVYHWLSLVHMAAAAAHHVAEHGEHAWCMSVSSEGNNKVRLMSTTNSQMRCRCLLAGCGCLAVCGTAGSPLPPFC